LCVIHVYIFQINTLINIEKHTMNTALSLMWWRERPVIGRFVLTLDDR